MPSRRIAILWTLLAAIAVTVGVAAWVGSQSRVSQDAISSAVTRDRETIDRAWRLPVAATFNRDVTWQSNASRCGPASIANVFRSLGEAAATEREVLARTWRCWTGICIMGLTLDELAEVARSQTRRQVSVLRDLDAEEFRRHLIRSNETGRRYVVNFTRKEIFGMGVGHHSPIAGYLEDLDLVFVLDVNKDFQPWLVERSRLFAAMNTFDGDRKRGLLLIE